MVCLATVEGECIGGDFETQVSWLHQKVDCMQWSIGQEVFQILLGPNCAPLKIYFSDIQTWLHKQRTDHSAVSWRPQWCPLKSIEFGQDTWWPLKDWASVCQLQWPSLHQYEGHFGLSESNKDYIPGKCFLRCPRPMPFKVIFILRIEKKRSLPFRLHFMAHMIVRSLWLPW